MCSKVIAKSRLTVSPVITGYDSTQATPMHCSRAERPTSLKRSYSASLPIHASQNLSANYLTGSPELCHPDLFVRGLDVGNGIQMPQHSDNSLTCQTPMQQQQLQMSGSVSGEILLDAMAEC